MITLRSIDKLKLLIASPSVILLLLLFVNSSEIADSTEPTSKEINEPIYHFVEVMPQVIGGVDEIYNYLSNTEQMNGQVLLKLHIDISGELKSVRVLNDFGLNSGHLAVDAIRKVSFKPGLNQGEAVNVSFIMPINFAP